MLIDHWPLLGLRLITPRLELRLPSDEELSELADLAAESMHEPGSMPFLVSWPSRRFRAATTRSCGRSEPSRGLACAITGGCLSESRDWHSAGRCSGSTAMIHPEGGARDPVDAGSIPPEPRRRYNPQRGRTTEDGKRQA